MTKSETAAALANVINFLGKDKKVVGPKENSVVPTAKVRSQINLLAGSTPESFSIFDTTMNIRTIAEGLFNWSGTPKVNKNVIRAMSKALNTPGKYDVAVELSAYLAAWAPLLEPDRIARLFALVETTDTAFGPALYTLQLHQRIEKVFGEYSPERQETLAASLWKESHTGRWWDLTAGRQPLNVDQAVIEDNNNELLIPDHATLTKNILDGTQLWHPSLVKQLLTLPENSEIVDKIEQYSIELIKGTSVDPDLALFSSYFPWVPITKRPESPIGSLLNELINLQKTISWDAPEKPKKFSDLFPPVSLWGTYYFPFADNIVLTDGLTVKNMRFELVKNATELAANKEYMGNCTWSYKSSIERGTYVLYRIHHNKNIYNASATLQGKRWVLREINSRFNRGQVPPEVRSVFTKLLTNLSYDAAQTQDRVHKYQQALTSSGGEDKKTAKANTNYHFQL